MGYSPPYPFFRATMSTTSAGLRCRSPGGRPGFVAELGRHVFGEVLLLDAIDERLPYAPLLDLLIHRLQYALECHEVAGGEIVAELFNLHGHPRVCKR